MKKSALLITLCILTLSMFSCSSSGQYLMDTEKTQTVINSGEFNFVAERANPTNMDVINVMNSMSYSNSARILNLDPGYFINIKKDEISVNLPYFGRAFVANVDNRKNSFDFTSKDFKIDTSKSTNKKTIWVITFNDQQSSPQFFIEISQNGKTLVSVNSRDRQAISYDGYISENQSVK